MSEHLTPWGWVFLIGGWSFIILLNVYCFANIFRERKEEIVDPLTNPEEDRL